MKTAVISALAVALLLFCSSQCDGKEQRGESEPSPRKWIVRSLPGDPNTPEAIREALQRYLSAPESPYSQEFNPVFRLGDRVLPYLIEAAIAENSEDWRVYSLLCHVLRYLSADARSDAARRLLEVLNDEETSIHVAGSVLGIIGCLGEAGLVIEPGLIEFRQNRPDLEVSTNSALIGIRSTQSGSILAKWLAKEPSESLLGRAAGVGAAARDAGPEVTKLLSHPNWDIRLAAARTLGCIGYTEAAPALIGLLDEPTDVRVNRQAAESLGRLGARSAVEALRKTAANHWHPAVRDKAKSALEHIASGKPYESKSRTRDPIFELLEETHWGVKSPAARKVEFVQEPPESKLSKKTAPEKMRALSYQSEIVGVGTGDEEERRAAQEKGAIVVVNDDGTVFYRHPIEQVPDVALRVEKGWLVGSDRGEWGGELVFVADDGQRTYVLKENVNDLFKLGEKYIAVTGLSHLSINDGHVREVKPVESGRWVCELWRALPGAPESCGKLRSGEVFISTCGGGDIILAKDGTFRMAP